MLDSSKFALHLRWRPMQPADVDACVDFVAAHPVIGPRYGPAIDDLRGAWGQLVDSADMTAAVFEQLDHDRGRIVGIGVGVFVHDAFIREIKTPPQFWFGPELARRALGPDSPILASAEVRTANSGEGLNLLLWEAFGLQEFSQRTDLYHLMASAYVENHRGFLLKEMITSQVDSVERLRWVVDVGGLYWNPAGQRYENASPGPPETFAAHPHVVGVTRELELLRAGTWVGTLFDYRPPRFGLSRREQHLLQAALWSPGGTDQELAGALGLSLATVKKTWGSIYRRVAACDPQLVPDSANADSGTGERGREKKRRLLAHVRAHPEELRLHSRKLLAENLQRPGGR